MKGQTKIELPIKDKYWRDSVKTDYHKNPVLLLNHDFTQLPIGYTKQIKEDSVVCAIDNSFWEKHGKDVMEYLVADPAYVKRRRKHVLVEISLISAKEKTNEGQN